MICSYLFCDNKFEPTRHKQKYCTPEHGIAENNRRGMERYHLKRKKKLIRVRVCRGDLCGTVLSRINESDLCELCQRKTKARKVNDLVSALLDK